MREELELFINATPGAWNFDNSFYNSPIKDIYPTTESSWSAMCFDPSNKRTSIYNMNGYL